jgi:hypothetical protein
MYVCTYVLTSERLIVLLRKGTVYNITLRLNFKGISVFCIGYCKGICKLRWKGQKRVGDSERRGCSKDGGKQAVPIIGDKIFTLRKSRQI